MRVPYAFSEEAATMRPQRVVINWNQGLAGVEKEKGQGKE